MTIATASPRNAASPARTAHPYPFGGLFVIGRSSGIGPELVENLLCSVAAVVIHHHDFVGIAPAVPAEYHEPYWRSGPPRCEPVSRPIASPG